jgi:A/G-specific adenine glycosylase
MLHLRLHVDLSIPLLRWYDRTRRELPWRETSDPYAIWVSEVMLQQTQVKTVIPYFQRWLARFPGVRELSRADEADVLHAWQGLGYYSRARALKRAAEVVVERHGGRLPSKATELTALPGIGPYSAGAIASIAYGERVPVVDGNVIRVLTRLYALRGDPAKAPLKHELWRRADELVPADRPGDHNQALMELGATVCVPEKPRCADCPLAKHCRGFSAGVAAELPELAARPKPTQLRMAAAVLKRRGRVAVVQLPPSAPRWAGMWLFPVVELRSGEAAERGAERALLEEIGVRASAEHQLGTVRHSVTRYRITLEVYECRALGAGARASGALTRWATAADLAGLAMPAAHRRIARWLGSADQA